MSSGVPEKVNIEFVNVLSEKRLRMRVWERSSGVTMPAAAQARARRWSRRTSAVWRDARAEIELDGGTLLDRWDEQTGHVLMTGPAAFVFDGEYEAHNARKARKNP